MTSPASQPKTIKAIGALNLEVCMTTESKSSVFNYLPFQTLVVAMETRQDIWRRLLFHLPSGDYERFYQMAVTRPIQVDPKIARMTVTPAGRTLKIKGTDRFMRRGFKLVFDALRTGENFAADALPGLHALITVDSSGALTEFILAFEIAHLRVTTWKRHLCLSYDMTPRELSWRDNQAVAASRIIGCKLDGCGLAREEMEVCPCGDAYYCCKEHAADDWRRGHFSVCSYKSQE